jgi:hypothetical protein
MEPKTNQTSGVAMTIVAVSVVVALVVGFGIGRATHKSKTVSTASNANVTMSAEALDNSMVNLGVQHMQLTDQAVDAALDGSPDATALSTALVNNGNTIGAAVGSVYGSSAQTTFDSVWKYHLTQFVNYAVADKEGNASAKQMALDNIQTGYTLPLAKFLAKANPYLPESTVQTLLSQHVAMTAQIIDDHVQGNYTKETSDLATSDQMITKIFSTLSGAIAKQYPSKFAS